MFSQAGPGFRIYCDTKARVLRVATNTFASVPGLKPQWDESEEFTTEEAWHNSAFSNRVTDEAVRETIDWFWIDMSQTSG